MFRKRKERAVHTIWAVGTGHRRVRWWLGIRLMVGQDTRAGLKQEWEVTNGEIPPNVVFNAKIGIFRGDG